MKNNKNKNQKPAVSDSYKGLKKETVTIIIKEQDGTVKKIKI